MTDKALSTETEGLAALCGLAATSSGQPGEPCPPETVMAAFIEHRLDQRQKQKMLAHLNRCEDCYQVWLETCLVMEEQTAQEAPKTPSAQSGKSWWDKIHMRLPSWTILAPSLAAATLAVAVVAVLVTRPLSPTGTPTLIALNQTSPEIASAAAQLPEPWAASPLAFDGNRYSPAERALAAGIWATKQRLGGVRQDAMPALLGNDLSRWQRPELKDYFQLGQWLASAWILAQSGTMATADWRQLDQTARALIHEFSARGEPESSKAVAILKQLQPLLQQMAERQPPPLRGQLARQLRIAMEKLFV